MQQTATGIVTELSGLFTKAVQAALIKYKAH